MAYHPIRALGALTILAMACASVSAAEQSSTQRRLLTPLDEPSLPGIGAWQVDALKVDLADGVESKLGTAALKVSGNSKQPGGKVDAPAFSGSLAGCQKLSMWVAPVENVDAVGFQIRDAEGEFLLQTVPADWTGWKQIEIAPTAGGMKQAYPQDKQDGKVDLPITGVNIIWFAKAAGPTSLNVDALAASVESSGDGVVFTSPASEVLEPNRPLNVRLIAENRGAAPAEVPVSYTLQSNPNYLEPIVPDPVLGLDHALGAKTTVSVDGEEKGDSKFCDGDEFTGFETPWGAGWKEAIATIDLGSERNVSGMRWQAGDANWVDKVDVLVSTDGKNFTPVEGLQGFVMKAKWGQNTMPWAKPVSARYIRMRFHKDGETTNCIRLPVSVMVYDGAENDTIELPKVGQVLASGQMRGTIPPRDFAEISGAGQEKLGPGAYLLSQEITTGGKKQVRIAHLLVRPADEVNQERTRRFGINGANTEPWMAENLKHCGFGWMRYENGKWMMFMPSKDRVAFDGSVGPWHLKFDEIFERYQKNGLKVLPYVFQTPDWANSAPADVKKNRAGYPPKDPADYGDAVFQLVARFGRNKVNPSLLKSDDKKSGLGMIDAVELWNEPNLNDPGWGPFVGPMTQYFDVLRAGAEGSRKADPTLPVTSCGFAGLGLEVVGLLSEHKYADGKMPLDFVDVVNVHFYSGRDEPETVGWDPNVDRNGPSNSGTTYPEELEDLVAWRERLKPKAEIWLTETGNDVGGPIGRTERHQAAKVPRAIMLALAAGVERVFIYREAGSDAAMHAGAGLLRNDGSTRPVWLTVATMIRQLQGFEGKALRIPSNDPSIWMYLWQDGQRRVVSAWTTSDTRKLGVNFGKGQVCDAFGRTSSIQDTASLEIGYFPTYIAISEPSANLDEMTRDAQRKADERKAARQRVSEMPMRLFDFGSAEHAGMLKGYGTPRRYTAITKDTVWNEAAGYGFSAPAAGDDDRRWIADALERDGCRIGPETTFRCKLGEGKHVLRVRATTINELEPQTVFVNASGTKQEKQVTKTEPFAEFTVQGGQEPVEVSVKQWGIIRWMTAMPIDAKRQ